MTRNARVLLPVLAMLAASCRGDAPAGDAAVDVVATVKKGDPEMAAAISRARSRLPEFWKAFEAPAGRDSFSVKVPITDGAGTEYFWLFDLSRAGERVFGTIGNRPTVVTSVRENQRIDVPQSEIADWMYMQDGKMHGNFTLRPLLRTLPPNQAEQLRAMLAEP
jgi:uncharacterized protein YegJ (DUF2314 family)